MYRRVYKAEHKRTGEFVVVKELKERYGHQRRSEVNKLMLYLGGTRGHTQFLTFITRRLTGSLSVVIWLPVQHLSPR